MDFKAARKFFLPHWNSSRMNFKTIFYSMVRRQKFNYRWRFPDSSVCSLILMLPNAVGKQPSSGVHNSWKKMDIKLMMMIKKEIKEKKQLKTQTTFMEEWVIFSLLNIEHYLKYSTAAEEVAKFQHLT